MGGAVGWVLRDYTDMGGSYSVPPPSVLPEPHMDPALASLWLVALECGAYEHRLSGLNPLGHRLCDLGPLLYLSIPQFPHGLWEIGWTTEMPGC